MIFALTHEQEVWNAYGTLIGLLLGPIIFSVIAIVALYFLCRFLWWIIKGTFTAVHCLLTDEPLPNSHEDIDA